MILAGDIGATKTVLGLYRDLAGTPIPVHEEVFPSREFAQFDHLIARFLEGRRGEPIATLCLGVAGPVCNGQSKMTNIPWVLDEQQLAKMFGIEKARLLNDVEAAAYGALFLSAGEKVALNMGVPQKGNIAVIAAGTGLGEAVLCWDGQEYLPTASEGGHTDFAPQSDQEIELLRFLRLEYEHVSYERIVSGPGIVNIYQFLRNTGFASYPEPVDLREALARGDPNAAITITERGLARKDARCVETLNLFAFLYGAEAGNLALKSFAIGGVYIGGGIAPKIIDKLMDGTFMRGFTDKGRYTDLMRKIPVKVLLNNRAPLIGAAHYALQMKKNQRPVS